MKNNDLLSEGNKVEFERDLNQFIRKLIDWKTDSSLVHRADDLNTTISTDALPLGGQSLDDSIEELVGSLDRNINFSSKKFMGFPDCGNSLAGLAGAVAEVFLQQNLINKDICSPMGTEVEADVLNWLRELIGYAVNNKLTDVSQLGGAVTTGGVMSNTYALMAAARKYPDKKIVILPNNIGHYSLSYATEWLNLDVKVVYCKTKQYRLDQVELKRLLHFYGESVLFVGVYACDSMTSTCEDLEGVYHVVKEVENDIWLHADACHGFALSFSDAYRSKVTYLRHYDSCTMDPHKVMWLPYNLSVVLMKNADDFGTLSRTNALIMDDPLSFGKTTPFIGSKPYDSLKLWMVMKTLGVHEIGEMVEARISNADLFYAILNSDINFYVGNDDILFSVIFQYVPDKDAEIEQINEVNRSIYRKMLSDGEYYFHGFDIMVNGSKRFVLRYNSGNIDVTEKELRAAVNYIKKLGKEIAHE